MLDPLLSDDRDLLSAGASASEPETSSSRASEERSEDERHVVARMSVPAGKQIPVVAAMGVIAE